MNKEKVREIWEEIVSEFDSEGIAFFISFLVIILLCMILYLFIIVPILGLFVICGTAIPYFGVKYFKKWLYGEEPKEEKKESYKEKWPGPR